LFFSPTGKLDHPSFGIAKYTDYRLKGFELRKAICIRESSIFSHARFISHFYPRLQAAKPDVELVLKLFYLILTHSIGTRPILFNIQGPDSFEIINGYGNKKISDMVQFQMGRQWRRFGLFNEKLDQTPTFLGIEPPELFDKDHLMLPRTTIATVHGKKETPIGIFTYAFSTENDEGGAKKDVIPLGLDFRVKQDKYKVGVSGFFSSISSGKSTSTVSLSSGSPKGGVLPWMSEDKYNVFGGFLEATPTRTLLIQAAYWTASHKAVRDPDSVVTLYNEAGINAAQEARFFGSSATRTAADVVTKADYDVSTWYLRLGYTVPTEIGTFTPYLFLDWMENPETIQNKEYGGDNEAGFADDGKFSKPSIGVVYKPINEVAIKFDGSTHSQKFNGKTETYPEVRFDISYSFKLK